jgi:hypothetical protein
MAATSLLLSATAVLAQQPAPGVGAEQPIGPPTVSPDSLRRMAEQLKLLQGAKLDAKLLRDIAAFQARNPHLTKEQVAEHFRNHPALQDRKQLEALQQWMRQFGVQPGENGQGGGGAFPPMRPDQPPVAPPPTPPPGKRPDPGKVPSSMVPPPSSGIPNPDRPGDGIQPLPVMRPGRQFDMQDGLNNRLPPPRAPQWNDGVSLETLERRQQQFRAFAGWWETNVGPLDETPALRQIMLEMFTGQSGTGTDAGSLGELLEGPAGEGFGKIADRLGGSDFKLPEFGFGRGEGRHSSFTPPPPPSGSSFGGFGGVNGGAGSWLPVVVLLVVAGLGLVLWWLWPKLMAQGDPGPRPLPGLGPWPVDPRHIADREALVRAFEYLSVLVCGGGARVWNHVTIASALERAVPQAEALADPLARLYAVARYTPADEPLPPGAIAEASEYLCELAGVPAA